ncbi:MAG: cytochrome C [Runella slithyformis]|nr:MAG: cytochrome C [Runella slithyformis]
MNRKLQNMAEQALIVSNIFIVFLLFFENQLIVPTWLQSVGRMHPLLLHFPIVVLLAAFGMEFFRFKSTYISNTFYLGFLNTLWLTGALLAAITVIMGLLLSKEQGYSGDTLLWHKWWSVGVLWFSTLFYWIRNAAWYKPILAKSMAATAALSVVMVGHFGATLTHGDGFISAPITQSAPVPLHEAVVFADVIQPIFEQKCVACHNSDKMNGELMFTDIKSILKGGKTGKLFVPGKPEISLLLERIHLPMGEKKHMPPTGKAQLSSQEITLLSLWIKGNADFTKKVTDLSPTDSLRIIASTLFSPVENTEEIYDFDAADESTIAKLRTAYRTIAPLARESPALSVSFFNKSNFTTEKLSELNAIKTQIVALNLSKMPVSDTDLKNIIPFENLQKLDLNFTNITGKGLKELTILKQLKTLSLSGTQLNFNDLQGTIGNFKNLKTITLWNTQLSVSEINKLQKARKDITFVAGFRDDGSNPIKLNPPQVKNSSTIFGQPILVQLYHPIKGTEIRYTTDGTMPDSIKSPLFNNQTLLKESASFRAKAYKTGWLGSDETTFDFYKSSFKPDSSHLLLALNRVHQAAGANTFFDGKLGTFSANSPAWANNWAGVRNNDLVLVSTFKTPILLSSVALRIMEETGAGIFPPESVEIWAGANKNSAKLLTTIKPSVPTKSRPHWLYAVEGKFKPQSISYLKIVAKPLQKIPDWHYSKGNKALLLVDEMFLK